MVAERRTAIEKVAEEMCASSNDTISGKRIVEIVDSTGLDAVKATAVEVRLCISIPPGGGGGGGFLPCNLTC